MQLMKFPKGLSRRLRCLGSSQPAGSSARRKPSTTSSTDATTAPTQQQRKARLPCASRLAKAPTHKATPLKRMRQNAYDQQLQQTVSNRPLKKVMAPFAGQQGPLKFKGDIRFANSQQQAVKWLDELLHCAETSPYAPIIVGCDTETPATFTRGVHKKTALLQLCYHSAQQDRHICLLIPLNRLGVVPQVSRVLSHRSIIKTGLAVAPDMLQLQKDYQKAAFTPIQSLLDLSWLAHACYTPKPPSAAKLEAMQSAQQQGLESPQGRQEGWGLAGLLACVSEYTLPKSRRIRCSNWAQHPLSPEQTAYAAADAYAGLVVYHSLQLKWLQVQQASEGTHRQSASANKSCRSDISTGQDVLAQSENGIVNGNNWGSAGDSATRVAAAKKQMPSQRYAANQDTNQHSASPQPSDKSAEMAYTWPVEQLANQHLWGSYHPAEHWQQAWEELILRGLEATDQELTRLKGNQAVKLDAAVTALGASLNRIHPPGAEAVFTNNQ